MKHCYPGLSIQKIANEFEKSKSLLYHHYDSKEDLLLDFLDHQLEAFREKAEEDSEEDVKEALMEKAFMAFDEETGMKGLVEIRTEGLRDERFRERFQEFSKAYREKLEELIEEGQKEGISKEDVDAEKVSKFVDAINEEAIFNGAMGEGTEHIREELEFYLDQKLFV